MLSATWRMGRLTSSTQDNSAARIPRPLRWWTLTAKGDDPDAPTADRTYDLVVFADRWALFRPDGRVAWAWVG